ncbi:MAG: shufflon system plasmid conjugative transfer pilus tip adhesin PilV [Acidithiobacillus sp.]
MSAILGVLFASLVGLLMIPTYMHFETMAIDNAKAATTAQQMQQVSQAAQAYIQANYSAVEANSTASSPATITVSMLQNTGYLPNAFSAANPFGQMWQVQVLQPTPGQLQALVLTQGGTQIGQVQAPMIAAQTGAQGGFVPYNGQYGTLNDTVAHGAYSGWQVSMSGYTNPGPGHLAALLAFNNGNLENNYLYRVAVPGQPQLNTMQTNLNMGANSVNNAQNVNVNQNVNAGVPGTAETGYCQTDAQGHCIGQIAAAGQSEGDLPAGWWGGIISRDVYGTGTIAAGTNNQVSAYMNSSGQIGGQSEQLAGGNPNGQYGSLQIGSNYYYGDSQNAAVRTPGSFYIQNQNGSGPASIAEVNNINAGGQVTANYDATLGTAGGAANVGWGCGPNGAIAANANGSGQLLVCQGGVWTINGSRSIVYQAWLGTNGFYNYQYFATAAYCSMNGYGQYTNSAGGISALSGSPGAYNWYYFVNSGSNDIYVTCYS